MEHVSREVAIGILSAVLFPSSPTLVRTDNCTISFRNTLLAPASPSFERSRSHVEGTIHREWRLFRFPARRVIGPNGDGGRGGRIGRPSRAEQRRRTPRLAGGSVARIRISTLQSLESAFRDYYASLRNSVGPPARARIARVRHRTRNCAIVPRTSFRTRVGHARALTVARLAGNGARPMYLRDYLRGVKGELGDSPTADRHIAAGRVQ